MLAAASLRGGVKLLAPEIGTEYAALVPPEDFTALSPNGPQLAVGPQDGSIYVWQIEQLRERLAESDLPPLAPAAAEDVPTIRARVELR